MGKKLSPSEVREAETAAKAESIQRLGQALGVPVSDEQAQAQADKRVRESCERRERKRR